MMLGFLDRTQRTLDWPFTKSLLQRLIANPQMGSPIHKHHAAPIMLKPSVPTSVPCLNGAGRPPAIAGFVVPIVVDAIQREAGRAFAHVGKKVAEVVPARAHARPFLFEIGAAWQRTLFHPRPNIIGARIPLTVDGSGLNARTPTGAILPWLKAVRTEWTYGAAIASAQPIADGFRWSGWMRGKLRSRRKDGHAPAPAPSKIKFAMSQLHEMHNTKRLAIPVLRAACYALVLCGLAACSSGGAVVPGRLAGPSPLVMVPPQPLPDPVEGDDAKALLAQCRAEYGRETGKLPPLQSFARRVTRPQ